MTAHYGRGTECPARSITAGCSGRSAAEPEGYMQTLIPFLAAFVAILCWGVSHYMGMIFVDHQNTPPSHFRSYTTFEHSSHLKAGDFAKRRVR